MTTTEALRVSHLAHRFKNHLALADVSFVVDAGSIHGFVGPNGAGKTTTLKVISTLMPPQTGSVTVFGADVLHDVRKVRATVGLMPDHFSMYRHMTVREFLEFFGAAYGLSAPERRRIAGDVLELTDMTGRADDMIQGLSRGMQQRVSLARVLVNDPKLLLLDEPASGLDPRARIELMAILRELARMGKTVFISSHILSELADLCDSVTIIDRGTVRYTGGMEKLLAQEGEERGYRFQTAEPAPEVVSSLRATPGVIEVDDTEPPRYRMRVRHEDLGPNQILRILLDAGATVVGFHEDLRHLNQVFMDLTEPGVR